MQHHIHKRHEIVSLRSYLVVHGGQARVSHGSQEVTLFYLRILVHYFSGQTEVYKPDFFQGLRAIFLIANNNVVWLDIVVNVPTLVQNLKSRDDFYPHSANS
jgi:hypothetical protein